MIVMGAGGWTLWWLHPQVPYSLEGKQGLPLEEGLYRQRGICTLVTG